MTKRDVQDILLVEKEMKFSSWKVDSKKFKELLPEKFSKGITPSRADEILNETLDKK